MKKFLKIAGYILLIIVVLLLGAIAYIKIALPNTGEPEYVTIERTPARIERGKYLANNVAVCMDCHSTRNWGLYAGPMDPSGFGAGGEVFNQQMGFPGVFYAPNITPYALKDWTDGELLRAITTGVDKDGKALFPVMGYHRFGKMDREDVYSMIAYIRTISSVEKDIPESQPDFPVNLLINTMPAKADFQKIPAASDTVNYGAYLINATGCVDCHSKTDKGTIVPGTEFGGGMEFLQPGGIVRSPNITFDKETGIGSWTAEAFTARFKMYAHPDYKPAQLKKDDLNTPMPWNMYAGMKESDLKAIYAYLKSLKPIKNRVVRYEK
ncbi:c-type cytochrome [Flavobacterium sp. DGU11]|uniref:C-type cytochrome n=1 Tax=Flavobacterium arundinis TaxID=3139143 RepID=A0ABU9HZY0_9FLAO